MKRSLIVLLVVLMLAAMAVVPASATGGLLDPNGGLSGSAVMASSPALDSGGVLTVNGWYEGEEIYYIDQGVEEGVTERGENQIYVIGSMPRQYQPQVVLFIPGEPGYTPHWNVNFVHTAEGVTLDDILASPYASEHFDSEGVLFDDADDILDAEAAGLVTIVHPGVVVLCPIISEQGADAPGNTQAPEDFPPFPDTF